MLGSMLIGLDGAVYAAEHLTLEDFWRAAHVTIFDACRDLLAQKTAIDFITLSARLKTRGCLDDVGGPAYVASLTDGVPRGTNIEHYCRVLRHLRLRRDCLTLGEKLRFEALSGALEGVELLGQAETWLVEIERRMGASALIPQSMAVPAAMVELERRIANPGALTGIETGFREINEYTGGWQAGDFIIVAARPSMGKTAWMLNAAVAAARLGMVVAIFSLEMTIRALEFRLWSSVSGVRLFKILHGNLTDLDQQRIGAAAAELGDMGLFMDDAATLTVTQIRTKCRQLKVSHGLDLVMVDYLQLVSGGGKYGSRQEEVADISRRLKGIGKDLDIPVIAFSQLSRASVDRKDKRPQLNDLRESGSLEQDADLVAFIHREDHAQAGATEWIIAKARNGPTGVLELYFDRDIVRFRDAAP